jgi:hypothetical protein
LDKLFKHDFDNLVPCHGSVITGNAKALLRDALKERGFAV